MSLDELSDCERATILSRESLRRDQYAMTLEEVGRALHMSRQMVWNVEQRALSKLRRMMGTDTMTSLRNLARQSQVVNERIREARGTNDES